eukprot:4444-Eustigmatos_ZCMA.PRE.1
MGSSSSTAISSPAHIPVSPARELDGKRVFGDIEPEMSQTDGEEDSDALRRDAVDLVVDARVGLGRHE